MIRALRGVVMQRVTLLPTKRGILFPKRIPLLKSPEKGEGSPPRPPTLQVWGLKSCTACGIRCGVHGFAMNPCVSLRLAAAPYYREARVTIAWRRTACRMRHCFARRIVKTGGRRKLVCTSTRWAERQRIVGAEANRIAMLTRLCRAQVLHSGGIKVIRARDRQSGTFLLGVQKGDILFREREYPPFTRSPRGRGSENHFF